MKRFVVLIAFLMHYNVYAQSLEEDIARNSISCFVGHSLAGSFMPRIANRYLTASFVLVGIEKTNEFLSAARLGAELYSAAASITEEEVGIELVYDFCPEVHELTAIGTQLGERIDEMALDLERRKIN